MTLRHQRTSRQLPRAMIPICVLASIAAIGPFLLNRAGFDPNQPDLAAVLTAPSSVHWFGTDLIGRDLFARVVSATRLDLLIAVCAVLLSSLTGGAIGMISALSGGTVDRILQRTIDVSMAFPLFVVALAVAAVLGNNVTSVILATAIINLPFYARLTRNETVVRLQARYIDAARLSGWTDGRIVRRLLLPGLVPLLMSQMTVNLGWSMLNGAGLSFLGLGIRPPAAEWGVLVGEGARYMITGQWWLVLFPGLALFVTVLSLTLAGDSLHGYFERADR